MPKVSVIVPVYNPGPLIDDCIRTLLGQTMPAADLELIFVDDGSTDGTSARLDALAAAHEHVRVEHLPNSGWPGRPRNVGIDMARGDYVYFVDNDDWLGAEALERLHGMALNDDADIVVGKVVGHGGKKVNRALFRRNLHGRRFEPLMLGVLTPHKLFRRQLLNDRALRFPEGRRRLEDHVFVVSAYFAARRISVVADYPCYHWALRDRDASASYGSFDAEEYFDGVRDVLDLVESNVQPGPERDGLLLHWYRGKMLGRLGADGLLKRGPEARRELFDAVRALALERFGPQMSAALPFHLGLRSRLLRDGNLDALVALAEFESRLQSTLRTRRVRGDTRHLVIDIQTRLGRDSLHLRREGDRLLWIVPEPLRDALGAELDVTEHVRAAHTTPILRSLDDQSEYVLPSSTRISYEEGPEPGLVRAVLDTTIRVTPTISAAGGPLPGGRWEIRAGTHVLGFYGVRRIRDRETGKPLVLTSLPPGRIVVGAEPPPPPGLRARVALSAPWLARAVRRTRAAVGAAGSS